MEISNESIYSVGFEIFTKNNPSFYASKLSDVMKRIFIAANKDTVTEADEEHYMKSRAIPDRVYYIYSNQIHDKIYDSVLFKNNNCVWFYISNVIDSIEKCPLSTIYHIYDILNENFTIGYSKNGFIKEENILLIDIYTIGLLKFISDTYGVIDLEDNIKSLKASFHLRGYTDESAEDFINNVIENLEEENYFKNRRYLDSYLLLKKRD